MPRLGTSSLATETEVQNLGFGKGKTQIQVLALSSLSGWSWASNVTSWCSAFDFRTIGGVVVSTELVGVTVSLLLVFGVLSSSSQISICTFMLNI